MPDQNSETAELFGTVEERRAQDYSDLDADLVREILEVQHRYAEDRAEARKRTEQIINRWLSVHAQGGDS
jgi:hypothetical protein